MSRQVVGAVLISAGVGILGGALLSWGEAIATAEKAAKARFDEQLEIHKRVLEQARIGVIEKIVETPAGIEAELILDKELKVGGEIKAETPIVPSKDYIGSAALYADPGTFINSEKVLSMEYIDAEDYEEEDGRAKEQVTIFMGGEEPIFVMDGEQIENWAELIGDHILVDFYQKVPPGETDRVLYVRNHKRDEDYEVWQTVP
jgi:hypothetical protein